jgi:hypothetical protein
VVKVICNRCLLVVIIKEWVWIAMEIIGWNQEAPTAFLHRGGTLRKQEVGVNSRQKIKARGHSEIPVCRQAGMLDSEL